MEIPRKTDYALRMLADLVRNPDGVVSVRTAARDNDIPYSFARSIQHDLALAGIVTNSRGAAGGMRLAVDPARTTLLELIEAVQGPVLVGGCVAAEGQACPRRACCCFNPVWCTAERLLRSLFSTVTLHQLVVEGLSPAFEGSFGLVATKGARALALGADGEPLSASASGMSPDADDDAATPDDAATHDAAAGEKDDAAAPDAAAGRA